MRLLRVFIFILIIFFQGCSKLCKDTELGFPRRENQGNALRLDGYYYGSLFEGNPERTTIYVLNKNGVFLNRRSFDLDDARSGNVNISISDEKKKYKSSWGVYRVDGEQIEIQSWFPLKTGCVRVLIEKGVILNDSTFNITTWQSSRDNKVNHVDATFRFVPYSPKPDSVVSFIP